MILRAKTLTTTEARQGSRTRLNLRVLVSSLVIAIAVFAVLYGTFLLMSPASQL